MGLIHHEQHDHDDEPADPQLRCYQRSPSTYAERARFIALLDRIRWGRNRSCCGGVNEDGEPMPDACDDGAPCWRHSRTWDLAERYKRRFWK